MMEAKAHSGSLRQFLEFADVCSIPLAEFVGPELLAIAESSKTLEYVAADALIEILQLCSAYMGRSDLGVSFAYWATHRGYGPFSLLWDHCSDLHDIVRVSREYVHLENEILVVGLDQSGSNPILTQMVSTPTRYGSTQYIEFTISIQVRTLRLILGSDWNPRRVQFSHPSTGITAQHQKLLRCPISFDERVSGTVLSHSDFSIRAPRHNPALLPYLEANLFSDILSSNHRGVVKQAKMILASQLKQGRISVEQVAAQLSMSKRSFQRRLSEEGLNFGQLVNEVRKTTALEFLTSEKRPSLSALAHRLGFSEASAASRFLRVHCGCGIKDFMAG